MSRPSIWYLDRHFSRLNSRDSLVVRFGQEKVKNVQRHDSAWIVSTFILDQDYWDEVNIFLKIMSICMSFFSFFMVTYFKNSMNTDLATVDVPKCITSYYEIMNTVDSIFLTIPNEETNAYFRNAKPGSLEYDVWTSTKDRQFPISTAFSGLAKLKETLPKMCDRKLCSTIISDSYKYFAAFIDCSIIRENNAPDKYVYLGSDPESKLYATAYPMNPRIFLPYKLAYNRRMRRLSETGWINNDMKDQMVANSFIEPTTSIRECVTYSVKKGELSSIDSVGLVNTFNVFKWFLIECALCIVVLFMETVYRMTSNVYRNRIKKKKIEPLKVDSNMDVTQDVSKNSRCHPQASFGYQR